MEEENNSSYSADLAYSHSSTLRERESRRQFVMRNNTPHQMINPQDEEEIIQIEDEVLQKYLDNPSSVLKNRNQLLNESGCPLVISHKNGLSNLNSYEIFSQGVSFHSENINLEDTSQAHKSNLIIQEQSKQQSEVYDNKNGNQQARSKLKSSSFNQLSTHHQSALGDQQVEEPKTPITLNHINLKCVTQGTSITKILSNLNNKPSFDLLESQQPKKSILIRSSDMMMVSKSDQHLKSMSSGKFLTETVINNNNSLIPEQQSRISNAQISQKAPFINLQMMPVPKLSIQEQEEQCNQNEKKRVSSAYFKFFKRTQFVQRFLSNLKMKATSYLFRHINSSQFNFIDDKTADFSFYQDHGILSEEESYFSLIRQSLLIVVYLFLIFFLPIYDNFKPKLLQSISFIKVVPLIVIPLDIFFKLNTAIYKRGMISKNREAILKEYLQTDAMLDLLIFVIYLTSQIFGSINILEYIITAKIIDVVNIIRALFQRYDQEFKHTTLSKFIILAVIVLTFLHTQAAIFVRIGFEEVSKGPNWIENITPYDMSSANIYIHSIYWSIITMTTIGYGDIHPVNSIEIVYVSVVSLVSCGVFGYSLNQIGAIVNEIKKKNEQHDKQMQILNSMMNQRQLDKSIQNQVRQYFEYLYKEEQLNDDTAISLIQMLPHAIKNSLLFDINHKLLQNQKLFSLNFSKQFLNQLCLEMKIMNIGPDLEIFSEGQVDERIYFITKGRVDITIHLNSKQKTCYSLQKGDMLGELEFFTKEVRNTQAKTVGVVSLTYLEFSDFLRCLQQFQSDEEIYYQIKDRAKNYENISDIGVQCRGCQKYNHTFLKCPSLNVMRNYPKVIKESQKSKIQQRDQFFKRFNRKKLNAFYQFQQNKKGYTQIIFHEDESDDNGDQSVSLPITHQQAGGNSSLSAFQKQQSFNFKQYKNLDDSCAKIQLMDNDTISSKVLQPESPQNLNQRRTTIIDGTELSKKMPQLFRGQQKKSSLGVPQQIPISEQKIQKKTSALMQQGNISDDPRTPTNTTSKRKMLCEITSKDLSQNQQQFMALQNLNPNLINSSTSQMKTLNQPVNQNNQQLFSPILAKYTNFNAPTLHHSKSIQMSNAEIENLGYTEFNNNNTTKPNGQIDQEDNQKTVGDLSLMYDIMIGYDQNNIRYYVNQESFDTFRSYKSYFPHNNITAVQKNYNRYLKLKNTQKRSKRWKKPPSS